MNPTVLGIEGLPNQDHWWFREGFPGVKIEIKAEGRVGIRQKKCFKQNCERENGTLEDIV